MRRFPHCTPYGGRFDSIVPHLTVAHGRAAAEAAEPEARQAFDAHGAIRSLCDALLLIENSSGHWRSMHAFALARHT